MFKFSQSRRQTRSTAFRDGSEDSVELLSGHEPLDHQVIVARWAQPKRLSVFNLPLRRPRTRDFCTVLVIVGIVAGIIALLLSGHNREEEPPPSRFPWDNFRRLDGYYQGISKLVRSEDFVPQNANVALGASRGNESTDPPISTSPIQEKRSEFALTAYTPRLKEFKDGKSPQRQQCYLQADNTIPAPAIYAFNGVPQHGILPILGSHDLLSLREDVCFDRYGRYGPYGLGYAVKKGGVGLGLHGDQSLTNFVWESSGLLNWSSFDLGDAQRQCVDRNRLIYPEMPQSSKSQFDAYLTENEDVDWQHHRPSADDISTISRSALVLRAWEGVKYTPAIKLYLRSLVNELSLQSGGEYGVHLLIQVRRESPLIWTSKAAYDQLLAKLVPEEFKTMATLWSEDLMQQMYPGPFQPQFHEHGSMYPAMRSMHFALQYFMLQNPQYEYFWNWEMDIRYIGHWYELFNTVSTWAKKQPRSYLWSRNARYYIPALYENWEAFSDDTRRKSLVDIIEKEEFKPNPTPGHEHDEEEEADFITFNPIFNPDGTEWNRREDVTGYDITQPIPERRAAIVAASRHSRRLLLAMHHENQHNRHSMASEMFPPTMALHHGLKAVYVPHPVYLERDWPPEYASEIFNGGPFGDTGNYEDSVFGESPQERQMALQQSTYFYGVKFAEFLWWRWLGYQDYRYHNEGGARDELKKDKTGVKKGRMCLRSVLIHPVKYDEGRTI